MPPYYIKKTFSINPEKVFFYFWGIIVFFKEYDIIVTNDLDD
ncbi:MAG: hypothetical protein PHZ27_06230 [Candidatus Omnitrophica bacterium]|nr:hypothetical protein [Candidatus Omnitrophota bacterium]